MAVISNLDILLGARTDKLDSGLDRTRGKVREFERDMSRVSVVANAAWAPVGDFFTDIIRIVPGATAAITAFNAIVAGMNAVSATSVAKEIGDVVTASRNASQQMGAGTTQTVATAAATRVVHQETRQAAIGMASYATAATVASTAVGAMAGQLAVVNTELLAMRGLMASAPGGVSRAVPRIGGASFAGPKPDIVDAEFTVLDAVPVRAAAASGAIGEVAAAASSMSAGGVAAGVAVAASFVAIAAAAVGTVVAVKAVTDGMREQMTAVDATGDAAKRLGMDFNDLIIAREGLGRSSGLEEGAIDASLSKMQLNLRNARENGGALNDTLKSLGLDAGQLLQSGPVEALKQVSNAAKEMKDPIDQSQLAMDLFGKSGVGLVTIFREGSGAIEEAASKAESANLKLTQSQVEQIGAANDAWEDMQAIATGAFRQLAAEFAPVITVIADNVREVGESFGGWEATLPAIVDFSVVLAGNFIDLAEAVTAVPIALEKIKMGNLSGAMDTLKAGLDFSTAENLLAQVQEARAEAQESARASKDKRDAEMETAAAAEASRDAAKAATEAADEASRDAAKAATEAADEAAKAEDRRKESIRDTLQSYADEVTSLRGGKVQVDSEKLIDAGASPFEIETFKMLVKQKEELEQINSLREQGKAIMEQYASPQEKLDQKLQELQRMVDEGFISADAAGKSAKDAANQLAEPQRDTPTFGALQRGSVEAYSAGLRNERSSQQRLQQEANVLLQQANAFHERLLTAVSKMTTVASAG